jgi:Rrf2 family transcriptional regulator, nitric oxide-sensitive transcriptional repressor
VFSQTTEYALRSMAWLAMTPGTLVPTGELAEATKVPPHYLAKVLQQMAAAKLITGRRGVGGGYKLAREPGEISLRDVVTAVTPIVRIGCCPMGEPGERLCPLHEAVDSITAAVLGTLGTTTLADLLSRPGHPAPLCTGEHRGSGPAIASPASVAAGANGVAANGTAKR